ncbi:MAG: HigA family addiction module antitoxin [Thermodesulfobacteriota bacterium]
MSKKVIPPVHPGETLMEDLMKPLGLSRKRLAQALGVDGRRINEIVSGRRSITGDTALRLARYFGTSPEFWMNLQARYDLETAKDKKLEEIQRTVKPRSASDYSPQRREDSQQAADPA